MSRNNTSLHHGQKLLPTQPGLQISFVFLTPACTFSFKNFQFWSRTDGIEKLDGFTGLGSAENKTFFDSLELINRTLHTNQTVTRKSH
jgi:hypothetical protein